MPQPLISQFDRKYGLPIETNRSVQNISQRNAIPEAVRWEGMIVHVIGDQSYILVDGIDNTAWETLGGLVDVNVVDDLLSTSPTDALSANQGRVLKDLIDNIDLSDYQLLSEKGSVNGYAPLDSGAKVPIANLPDSVVGQVEYQGTWAASTNTPTLSNPPDSSTKGHYYVCSDSGTQFSISFQTGDWIISNGSAWEKVDNTDAVTSVFGRLGNVVANSGDYAAYYLGISAKADDSELLDGINSTQFLRSDVADEKTAGTLTLNDNIALRFGTSGGESSMYSNGNHTFLDLQNGDFFIRDGTTQRFIFAENGDLTASGSGNFGVFARIGGSNPTLQLNSSALGIAHTGWISYRDNTNIERAYVGFGSTSNSHFTISNSYSSKQLVLESGGNLTYNGNIVATSYQTTNWQIIQSGTTLQFKYNGTTMFEMNSSGIMEAMDFKLGL